jgi:hypothetical protein
MKAVIAATTVAIVLVPAGVYAADQITGHDIANNSVRSHDVDNLKLKDLGKKLKTKVKRLAQDGADAATVVGALPDQGFDRTNTSVSATPDGVEFGPYTDGGTEGGSLCYDGLNGQPLSSVQSLVYFARYISDGDTGGVGVPYLRIFLEDDTHDAIFSPNTQPPDSDTAEGPFHTWVATSGLWRYDDDAGAGGEYGLIGAPFSEVLSDHGTEVISSICVTTGFSAGADLAALLRTFEVNGEVFRFTG